MKNLSKILLPALILSLLLTACGKSKPGINGTQNETQTETTKESIKETTYETNNEITRETEDEFEGIMHRGVYLGNGLFLDKIKDNQEDIYNLMYVTTPDNSQLKVGNSYEYNVHTIQESMPPQTTVEEIKEVEDNKIVKINDITASLLSQYIDSDNMDINMVYKSADNIVKSSIEYSESSLEDLDKFGIVITYGKESEELSKTFKERGFNLVFDLGDDKDIKELEME